MSTTQSDPDSLVAQIADQLKKVAEGEAACRVAAIDACLLFRNLMIADPEQAMAHVEAIGKVLVKAGRTYKNLKTAARRADEYMGQSEKRGLLS